MVPTYRDFEHYATAHGASRLDFGDPALHGGAAHVPASTRKRQLALQNEKDHKLELKRDALREQWETGLASGSIRQLSRIERYQETAKGTGPAAEAAQRILASMERMNNVAE